VVQNKAFGAIWRNPKFRGVADIMVLSFNINQLKLTPCKKAGSKGPGFDLTLEKKR
jgi:hypothetical protein